VSVAYDYQAQRNAGLMSDEIIIRRRCGTARRIEVVERKGYSYWSDNN
jgi:hypothetical protein